MNLKAVQNFCASLPAATGDVKWGIDYVYSVGNKMFAVACPDNDGRAAVSFKVDAERFLELTDRAGFIPAPYLARAKWVQIIDLKQVGDAELKALLSRSHELVAAGLTKKLRSSLGLAGPAALHFAAPPAKPPVVATRNARRKT
ncbi:MAG: MmcQ/YjbR family DNA-binding protein [Burkholderiales bacterium]|nr:MmcQ/YjbR family DNA-binding protein [Burkholderiales bacterium]